MPSPFFTFDPEVSPVCQIGMSDKRQAEPDSWLDVSCYVHEAELFRGRERFNDRFEPGTATITFDNDNGWADLVGAYSAVAAQKLRPGRQIRIGVRGPWNRGQAPFVRWLWRGFIDQSKPAYDPVEHDFVTVNCIDALGEAGSATAPTGDFQGVNETAATRINRVLNAVGWWNNKRSVAGTTTRVQGTELGGAAIDHMGQAADSAGGVVYGDLAGNVVFRDIDWMLYDGDVPEDDEIGNCTPGTPPIDDQPPYIDPDPGPVHDPDDPPAEHPPRVCVCSDGRSGTIVEKGDLYKIYVKGGHLFYYSQGHTWDLGPYAGGCTCISPPAPNPDNPPPPPIDPDLPPTPPLPPLPPIRYDPPIDNPDAPEDEWPPVDTNPPEVPSLFAVEFLGYSDAGLSDPPAAAVTVAGIHPGHDCLLVVLIDALGSLTNTVGLAPVVSGGGLDWAHSRGVDRTSGIASSFIVAAEVGRDDPGTFDVVTTWATPMTSRTHIVTVWKVTAAVNDYLTRFDAGAVLAAVLTSTPPEFVNPGDGPVTVDLASDRQPLGVAVPTRITDITIAQSLAEETTGPYGAVLSEADGPWTTPLFADIPAPASVAAEAVCDDFERADGPLGAGWITGHAPPNWTGEVTDFMIVDGAAVLPTLDGSSVASALTTETSSGDHAIEITAANQWQAMVTDGNGDLVVEGEWWMLCKANTSDQSAYAAYVFPFTGAGTAPNTDRNAWAGEVNVTFYQITPLGEILQWSGNDAVVTPFPWQDDPDVVYRFEAAADTLRFYVNGELLLESAVPDTDTDGGSMLPHPTGDRVGWICNSYTTAFEPPQPANDGPWQTLEVCVGGGGITRKCSWVAGWRQGIASATVMVEDVNTGVDNIQSAQACLVLESAEAALGHRVLDYDLHADPTGLTPGGTLLLTNQPRAGTFVVVFVGVTAIDDVIDAVAVTGADFTRNHVQHLAGESRGQGSIWTCKVPLDVDLSGWSITVTHPDLLSVSAVAYEVTAQDATTPVGGVASGVLGNIGTAGSVDGPSSITLSAPGDPNGVGLAFLHVSTLDPSPTSGAASVDGDEWAEDLEYSPAIQAGYIQTMSRAPGQPESTSTNVPWDDVATGDTLTLSGIQLAIEVRHAADAFSSGGSADPVFLGGRTDALDGPITSAEASDPLTGETIWTFP